VLHGFVVDFHCPALRLVLELHAAPHDPSAQVGYDAARTALLAAPGYRVIRIRNKDLTHEHLKALLRQALGGTQTIAGQGVRTTGGAGRRHRGR
jgi:very-short-patch-repair endonuclease